MATVTPGRRQWVAVVVAVAIGSGPSGLAASVHPADDISCARSILASTTTDSARLVRASREDIHCATCHLLRGLHWGMSVASVPAVAPHDVCGQLGMGYTSCPHGPTQPTTGRSPPDVA
jgi:hypothetical protein